jgi:GNAT superfamily N-acetyltransferase
VRVVHIPWTATVGLRSTVLGWSDAQTRPDSDPEARHAAVLDSDGQVAAVVSMMMWPCPDRDGIRAVYFWGMAVAADRQRSGYGRRLLSEVLDYGRRRGADIVWADARAEAVPFYEACGAAVVGEPYLDEVTGRIDRRVVIENTVVIENRAEHRTPGSTSSAARGRGCGRPR